MRSVVVTETGESPVVEVLDQSTPDPRAGQLRVRVTAAGINPVDAYNAVDPTWAGLTPPWTPGYDIAGTVDAVGEGVDPLRLGQRVCAMTAFPRGQGGYAEYAVVDDELVATLGDDADLVAAASIPLAAGTAWEALERLKPVGNRMLVFGASGGVGLFLIQLAAAADIKVIAVGRERSHAVMRDFGAFGCVDYKSPDYLAQAARQAGGPFDSITDLAGGPLVNAALPHLRDDGHIVAIGPTEIDVDQLIDKNLVLHGILIRDNGDRTRHVSRLFDAGHLRTHVTHVLPLEDVAHAQRLLESGAAAGKVVLTP